VLDLGWVAVRAEDLLELFRVTQVDLEFLAFFISAFEFQYDGREETFDADFVLDCLVGQQVDPRGAVSSHFVLTGLSLHHHYFAEFILHVFDFDASVHDR
jgi:hypothetical protein